MPQWLRRALAWCRTEWAAHRKVHLIDALLVAQRDGFAAERKVFELTRRLDLRVWMDIQMRKERDGLQAQVSHWIAQTERAEGVAKAAIDDRDEAIQRVLYLEKELEDLTRSRDELIEIGDNLRAELKLPRVAVTTTRQKARR